MQHGHYKVLILQIKPSWKIVLGSVRTCFLSIPWPSAGDKEELWLRKGIWPLTLLLTCPKTYSMASWRPLWVLSLYLCPCYPGYQVWRESICNTSRHSPLLETFHDPKVNAVHPWSYPLWASSSFCQPKAAQAKLGCHGGCMPRTLAPHITPFGQKLLVKLVTSADVATTTGG